MLTSTTTITNHDNRWEIFHVICRNLTPSGGANKWIAGSLHRVNFPRQRYVKFPSVLLFLIQLDVISYDCHGFNLVFGYSLVGLIFFKTPVSLLNSLSSLNIPKTFFFGFCRKRFWTHRCFAIFSTQRVFLFHAAKIFWSTLFAGFQFCLEQKKSVLFFVLIMLRLRLLRIRSQLTPVVFHANFSRIPRLIFFAFLFFKLEISASLAHVLTVFFSVIFFWCVFFAHRTALRFFGIFVRTCTCMRILIITKKITPHFLVHHYVIIAWFQSGR